MLVIGVLAMLVARAQEQNYWTTLFRTWRIGDPDTEGLAASAPRDDLTYLIPIGLPMPLATCAFTSFPGCEIAKAERERHDWKNADFRDFRASGPKHEYALQVAMRI